MININDIFIEKIMPTLRPGSTTTLLAICKHMNANNRCFPNRTTLKRLTGVGRDALSVYLRELKDQGIISAKQRRKSGGGFSSNEYKVNMKYISVFVSVDNFTMDGLEPEESTENGKTVDVITDDGLSGNGKAVDGKPGHKVLTSPLEVLTNLGNKKVNKKEIQLPNGVVTGEGKGTLIEGEEEPKKKLTVPAAKKMFESFRQNYKGVKPGSKVAWDFFVLKNKEDYLDLVLKLQPGLDYQNEARKRMKVKKMFVSEWRNLKTWIFNRGWEDEFPIMVINIETKKEVGRKLNGQRDFSTWIDHGTIYEHPVTGEQVMKTGRQMLKS